MVQGYRVPYEPETVSAKITESAGENSRVSGWQQQYFAGVYYGVILADTVVRVWGIVRETRRGAVSGAAIGISEGREHRSFGADHDDDKRQCRQHLGSFDARQMDAIRRCIEISIGQAIPKRENLP